MGKLEIGNTYLIKKYGSVLKIKVIEITETCYNILFVDSGNRTWEEIMEFETSVIVLEDLGKKSSFTIY